MGLDSSRSCAGSTGNRGGRRTAFNKDVAVRCSLRYRRKKKAMVMSQRRDKCSTLVREIPGQGEGERRRAKYDGEDRAWVE